MRITLEDFLNEDRQAVEPLAHVGMAGREPHLHPAGITIISLPLQSFGQCSSACRRHTLG